MCGLFKNIVSVMVVMVIFVALPSFAAVYSIDCSIGFNGHFQLNSWTPISLVLDNRGPATHGKLEVVVTSGSEYQRDIYRTIHAADVDLPHNSTKRYAFTVKIQSFTHELIIRLRQDVDIIFSKSINLRPHFTDKNLAVVADNSVAPDILSVLPQHLYPANVRPNYLPEAWYGYEGVKLLIMGANAVRQLSERQFEALTRWIKQGGQLVMGGSLNYGSLGEKRIRDILPIKVRGHRQFFELKSLEHFCSQKLTSIKPFLVLNVAIDDAKVLVKENDIPLIIQKKLGFGRIVFLSFDMNTPPFSRWDGRQMLWDKILSVQSGVDRQMVDVDNQRILDSMLTGLPLKFPDFRSGLIFIGVYLIILRILLTKIRRPGRSRWKFGLCIIVMISIFTYIGYRGFYYPHLKQNFAYNSLCRLNVSGTEALAFARYYIGLYSLKNTEYGVNFGSWSFPVSHLKSEKSNQKIPNPYVLHTKESGQHIIGSINRWSHNFYMLNLNLDSPLAGYARQDNSFLTLTVESKLPHNLVDCLIFYKKRFIFIEDISANKRQIVKLNLTKLKKNEIFNDQEVDKIMGRFDGNGSSFYLRKTQQNLTPDLLLEIHNKYKTKPDSIILIGWIQADMIRPQFSQPVPLGNGLTMVNWELQVETTS
jgi:hypothetical protein